jgi:hypothetical protein
MAFNVALLAIFDDLWCDLVNKNTIQNGRGRNN